MSAKFDEFSSHCLFKILRKNQNVQTDGRTGMERRMDKVKTVYPHSLCVGVGGGGGGGGIIIKVITSLVP